MAVKVDENIRFLIEVKAVGIELKDIHIKQAIDYAANEGIEWVILTNGAVWRVYNVHFGQPIEKILVCEVKDERRPRTLTPWLRVLDSRSTR